MRFGCAWVVVLVGGALVIVTGIVLARAIFAEFGVDGVSAIMAVILAGGFVGVGLTVVSAVSASMRGGE